MINITITWIYTVFIYDPQPWRNIIFNLTICFSRTIKHEHFTSSFIKIVDLSQQIDSLSFKYGGVDRPVMCRCLEFQFFTF